MKENKKDGKEYVVVFNYKTKHASVDLLGLLK